MTDSIAVRNPRTGESDYSIHPPGDAELAALCARLRNYQAAWHETGFAERCRILAEWAESAVANQALLDALCTDTGRRLVSKVEIGSLPRIVGRWAEAAPRLLDEGPERDSVTPGVGLRDHLVPYRLVGVISPWNFPFLLSMIDAIPALTAGCAVLVKPSEVTPRFIEPLTESIAAFPELNDVFAFVAGDGRTGAAMIEQVDALAFTGSVATGRKVAEGCARHFIPAFLELGGKDPAVVLPSADPATAAKAVLRASVQATGQACQSLERVYVHRDMHDEFVRTLVGMANDVKLAYPGMGDGHIGPLIFGKQADIIADHIADAKAKGATVRCGGEIEHHGGGVWIRPTVLTGVDHTMKVMREETFGPVIPVMAYGAIDEAIELANDTDYGLSASVIGSDVDEANAVARRINAGAVGINDGAMTVDVQDASHDSFGLSGMGISRMGDSGLLRFLRRKAVMIRRTEARGVESLLE